MLTDARNGHLQRRSHEALFEVLFLLIVLVASYHHVTLKILLTEDIGGHGLNLFRQVASHDAPKPWQYRLLFPEIVSFIARLGLQHFSDMGRLWKLTELLSLALLVFAFRSYIRIFIKDKMASAMLSFLILVVLPFNLFFPRPYYAFYWFDTPAMLFFTLGLITLYKRRWLAYYAILALSTLNRETSFFLIIVYFLTSIGKDAPFTIFKQCAAQLALWLSIKLILYAIFFDNPGPVQGFEIYNDPSTTHLGDNLSYLLDPSKSIFMLSHMGYLWLFPLAGFGLIRDNFVKRSTLAGIPYFFGMMIVANIYELRVFCELIPVFLMAYILMLKNAASDQQTETPLR